MDVGDISARRAAVGWSDVLVTAAVAGLSVGALVLSDEPGARPPDALAVVLLISIALPLLGRRVWPTAVVVAVGALTMVSFASGYPGGPPTLPLLVALYAVAAAGHRWWSLAVTVVFAGGGLLFRVLVEADPPVSIALDSALFVLVSLLGDAVHSRRRLTDVTREQLRLAEAEREAETQRRVTEERLRIARELHDVMAHTVTTMSVQAGAALDSIEDRPELARGALTDMRAASRQAMQELRATVSLLRDGTSEAPADEGATRRPAPGLAQLDELLAGVRRAGIEVDRQAVGEPFDLLPATDLTAFRIVQEALTNVIRHADATSVRLRLAYDDTLIISIDDDGCGLPAAPTNGFGLRGLRERVEAVGGHLQVGPAPRGGLRVRAELPRPEAAP
jgi:signal transduction histidine kinase